MDKHAKYLLRLAGVIQASLSKQSNPRLAAAASTLSQLCDQLEYLKQAQARLTICQQRGWDLAGQHLLRNLHYPLQDLSGDLARCDRLVNAAPQQTPTLGQLYDELTQAEQEFDDVAYRRQDGVLVVTTQPIVLEGIQLGRFEIQLVLDRLCTPEPHQALRIVALEPNPASSDERVTHPHVSDEGLCAGDASAPVRTALASGRVCDVFLLVRAVLETYNSGSPYVSLERWDGTVCEDCGYCVSADHMHGCESCGNDHCDDCISYCRSCDTNLCRGCLRKCSRCDETICESCLQDCRRCGAQCLPGLSGSRPLLKLY